MHKHIGLMFSLYLGQTIVIIINFTKNHWFHRLSHCLEKTDGFVENVGDVTSRLVWFVLRGTFRPTYGPTKRAERRWSGVDVILCNISIRQCWIHSWLKRDDKEAYWVTHGSSTVTAQHETILRGRQWKDRTGYLPPPPKHLPWTPPPAKTNMADICPPGLGLGSKVMGLVFYGYGWGNRIRVRIIWVRVTPRGQASCQCQCKFENLFIYLLNSQLHNMIHIVPDKWQPCRLQL